MMFLEITIVDGIRRCIRVDDIQELAECDDGDCLVYIQNQENPLVVHEQYEDVARRLFVVTGKGALQPRSYRAPKQEMAAE